MICTIYNQMYLIKIIQWFSWGCLIVLLLLFNNLLGAYLGRIGNCHSAVISHSVHLYTSCRGETSNLITGLLRAEIITVGDNILTPAASVSANLTLHELAHVRIYHILGPAYLPVYGCAQIAAWLDTRIYNYHNLSDSNIIEFWANSLVPTLTNN